MARHWNEAEPLNWYARRCAVIPVLGLLSLLFLLAGTRALFYQPFYTPTASMSPALNIGDNFFVSKRAFDHRQPQRGDIIVFNVPALKAAYVKRVVGVAGDRVQMMKGVIYLNGTPIPQRYIGQVRDHSFKGRELVETFPDGRTHRIINTTPDDLFDDTKAFVVPQKHFFVLGDNRDNSIDSRNKIGFVDESDVIGEPLRLFWNGETRRLDFSKVE
jgi:signal peptidase I